MSSLFADKFKGLRIEKGLSQRRAAAALGISQALLSHYENDAREPKLDFVIKACEYYGVSADYILGRSKERGSNVTVLTDAVRETVESLEESHKAEAELIKRLKKLIKED